MLRVVITSSPGTPGGTGAPVRVDDLGIEMVLGKMEAPVGAAAEGQARPHDLGDAVGRGDLTWKPASISRRTGSGSGEATSRALFRLNSAGVRPMRAITVRRCRARGGVVTRTEVL